jgi:hypothetical protein
VGLNINVTRTLQQSSGNHQAAAILIFLENWIIKCHWIRSGRWVKVDFLPRTPSPCCRHIQRKTCGGGMRGVSDGFAEAGKRHVRCGLPNVAIIFFSSFLTQNAPNFFFV